MKFKTCQNTLWKLFLNKFDIVNFVLEFFQSTLWCNYTFGLIHFFEVELFLYFKHYADYVQAKTQQLLSKFYNYFD